VCERECVSVCVCGTNGSRTTKAHLCVREREIERERVRDRESLCVYVHVLEVTVQGGENP